jgi:hypothetical protein
VWGGGTGWSDDINASLDGDDEEVLALEAGCFKTRIWGETRRTVHHTQSIDCLGV